MTRSMPRIAAAVLLAVSGATLAVTAFGLVVAKLVIGAGLPQAVVSAADAALLDDLVALTPFVSAVAVASLATAAGLATGRRWGDRLATAIATVATSVGAFAFILVALGHDPFTTRSSLAAAGDGLGIIAAFTAVHVAVLVALAVAGEPDGRLAPAPRVSLPAAA